jgi:hypothetical protein
MRVLRPILLVMAFVGWAGAACAQRPDVNPYHHGNNHVDLLKQRGMDPYQRGDIRNALQDERNNQAPGIYSERYAEQHAGQQYQPAPPEELSDEAIQDYRAAVRQDGQDIQAPDIPPIMWNDVIYVSARTFFGALQTTAYWADSIHSAVAKLPDGRAVIVPLGQSTVTIDTKSVKLARPSASVNNIMMVPLRDLAEALGYNVQWDPETDVATLAPGPKAAGTAAPTTGAAPAATTPAKPTLNY